MLKIVKCAWENSDVSSSVQDFHRLHFEIVTSAAASTPKEVGAYPQRGSGPVSQAHLERRLRLDLFTRSNAFEKSIRYTYRDFPMFSCLSLRRFSMNRLSDVRLSLVKPPLHGSMLLKPPLTKDSHYKLPFRITFQRLVGLLHLCSYLGCLKIACLLLYKWRNVSPRTMTLENYVEWLCSTLNTCGTHSESFSLHAFDSSTSIPLTAVDVLFYKQWMHSSVSRVVKLPIMILNAIYFWRETIRA